MPIWQTTLTRATYRSAFEIPNNEYINTGSVGQGLILSVWNSVRRQYSKKSTETSASSSISGRGKSLHIVFTQTQPVTQLFRRLGEVQSTTEVPEQRSVMMHTFLVSWEIRWDQMSSVRGLAGAWCKVQCILAYRCKYPWATYLFISKKSLNKAFLFPFFSYSYRNQTFSDQFSHITKKLVNNWKGGLRARLAFRQTLSIQTKLDFLVSSGKIVTQLMLMLRNLSSLSK